MGTVMSGVLDSSKSNESVASSSFDTESESELYIYILKLEKGKWYVGSTTDVDRRYKQHLSGRGSAWTKKYHPISISDQFKGDSFDEDKTVKVCMTKYGIANVRGGSYSNCRLTKIQLSALTSEIQGATNLCWKCGSDKHLSTYCKTGKTKVVRNGQVKYVKKRTCNRCGRNNHNISRCYATTHLDGHDL